MINEDELRAGDRGTQAPAQIPTQGNDPNYMKRFGYLGPLGLNLPEQQYVQGGQVMAGQAFNPLANPYQQALFPSLGFNQSVIGGAFAPGSQYYREQLYNPIREEAMRNYGRVSQNLAQNFSNRGAYFGGRHSLAQSELANQATTSLNKLLADLNLSGYESDMNRRMQGSQFLGGMAPTMQSMQSRALSQLGSGGQLVSGREQFNRAEYQNALQRSYQDWARARQEQMMPFQYFLSLMGQQPFQNIVQQPSPNPWGQFLGGLGSGLGQGLGSMIPIP